MDYSIKRKDKMTKEDHIEANKPSDSYPIAMSEHIINEHQDNKQQFALSVGTSPQQIQKWGKSNTLWFKGQVWRQATQL